MNGLNQLTGAMLDYLAGTGKFEDVKLLHAFPSGIGPYPITRPMLALRPRSAAVRRTAFSDDFGEEGTAPVRGRMAQIECGAEIYVPAGQDGMAAQALFDRLCSALLLAENPFCIHTASVSKQTYEKALEAFRIEAVFSLDAILASVGTADGEESTEAGLAAVSSAEMPEIHDAGWCEASLPELPGMLRVLPVASGEEVSIWAGEHKLAQVERYQISADRALHLIEACDEASPVGFVSGEPVYQIVLDRIWALPAAEDLESLDSFTLTVRRPGCTVRYGGCIWTRMERSARGNGLLMERAEIMAFSRTVSQMKGGETEWSTENEG